jgi:imidazolonepropionase-like amidohydrolase
MTSPSNLTTAFDPMRWIVAASVALTACGGTARTSRLPDASAIIEAPYALINGRWFDGDSFVNRTAYVADGKLTFVRPPSIRGTLDLAGGHVIPPLTEAHNHNLGGYEDTAAVRAYLDAGVFYVKILSNLPRLTDPVRHLFNNPRSVDVVFATGPLTASGGHPIRLRERLLSQGVYPGFTRETLKDHGYFVIDNAADIDAKWPLILAGKPDFIKIVLVYSEEFAKRRDDTAYFGMKGLDPDLVPAIVARARQHGLRLSAHVNTATDFRNAVRAGVDELAHSPGFDAPSLLSDADVQAAKAAGVTVVTTASLARRRPPELLPRLQEAQRSNLSRLIAAGVPVAIGSDNYDDTSVGEALYLKELGIDNRTLLRMWTENGARTTFPGRKIGALREGYEASFLVLGANPLSDFANVRRIVLAVKEGVVLVAGERTRE